MPASSNPRPDHHDLPGRRRGSALQRYACAILVLVAASVLVSACSTGGANSGKQVATVTVTDRSKTQKDSKPGEASSAAGSPVSDVTDNLGHSTGEATQGGNRAAECELGELTLTAATTLPSNYLPADGRLLEIVGHEALFSLIGTKYGGDGNTNFALPDLRKVTPNHMTYGFCVDGTYPAK